MDFSPIPEILDEIREGRMVILVDDPDRENEGDLAIAAEKVTPEAINFMVTHGRGLVCLAMSPQLVNALELPMQLDSENRNTSQLETAFTVSIDAREGVTTGISAQDRAKTILTAIREDCRRSDLVVPGHVFPLRSREGGVLVRAGQTEGVVDLARLSRLKPAGVICEILNENGTMARVPELEKFAHKYGLKMCCISDLIKYRLVQKHELLVERLPRVSLPTRYGNFDLYLYKSLVDNQHHVVLCRNLPIIKNGEVQAIEEPVLVRVHSECLTGDIFHSSRCDCGQQKDESLRLIAKEKRGAFLYMRQEGRGIGLENKIRAYHLQEQGLDTVEANERLGFKPDERHYGTGAQILFDLGITKMRLLTNNPKKYSSLEGYGLEIFDRIPLQFTPTEQNRRYLLAKKEKLGHFLELDNKEANCKRP